jgi:hypothetical protein
VKIVFLKKKRIDLGEQSITELTLLEYKKWFSIKLFNFHKSGGVQDRFHTHAFNAYSFLLKGDYTEEVLEDNKIIKCLRSRSKALFIPKDSYHRITRSKGCVTLLVTGPWGETFKELRNTVGNTYQEVVCGSQRKDLNIGVVRELTYEIR